jgi:L-ascorbate metabolism protein UlaG (beta-lactamase superfamily)
VGPVAVGLTWLGITNWLVEYDDTVVLLDAYYSRPQLGAEGSLPQGLTHLERILAAASITEVDAIMVGHSHYDHAVDAGTAALATGAQVYGSPTTCRITAAQGLPADRCTVVRDGDAVEIGSATVSVHFVIHWSPETFAGQLGVLDDVPDPETVSLAPNGGVLAYRFSFDPSNTASLLFQDTFGPVGGSDGSSRDYPAALAEIPQTDVWIGAPSFADTVDEVAPYVDTLSPRYLLPHHFDPLDAVIEEGLTEPYMEPSWVSDALGDVRVEAPSQYFDAYRYDGEALIRVSSPVQQAFGLAP